MKANLIEKGWTEPQASESAREGIFWPGMTLPLVIVAVALVAYAFVAVIRSRGAAPVENTSDFQNDSGRNHESLSAQTWAAFLRKTYRKQKNSGANVKLGNGFEIGIVGESFHVSELRWIRSQCGDVRKYRTRFTAYLVPEPENPHSPQCEAVRVESPRGGTIGHLSSAHAAAYAPVFKVLHESRRVGVCHAVAVGGTQRKPNIGVWLNIGHSAWLAEQIVEAQAPPKPRKKREKPATPAPEQAF